jgi:hypothetical protein
MTQFNDNKMIKFQDDNGNDAYIPFSYNNNPKESILKSTFVKEEDNGETFYDSAKPTSTEKKRY